MPTVRVDGTPGEIPVGKILCVGRNYRAHAAEMGADIPKIPVLFLKPSTALVDPENPIRLPGFSSDVHHEVEMVAMIGMEGRDIPVADAMDYVSAYGVGLDLTARDVQAEAKKKGLPWSVAKGFDCAAPLSRLVRSDEVKDPHDLELVLRVNGEVRQQSSTSNMIFRIEEIVAYASTIFTLQCGDLIFTGTPEGVGPIVPGDRLHLNLGDIVDARFEVVSA